VFRNAVKLYCKIPDRDVLCPVIFFIDKTHTDLHGNLCLEPVAMTLAIFNRATRNKASAWRTIGYCVNHSNCSTTSPLQKAQDFHSVLTVLLQPLWELQQTDGLAWQLQFKNRLFSVVFKLPILFIIGDTEGHDKLVGKYNARTSRVARLCRYCDCSYDDTDNPHKVFRYTKQSQIQRLVRKKDEAGLKEISYRMVENAWHRMVFCDPVRGIHGACPAEDMHVNRTGNQLRLIDGILACKRSLKRQRKSDPIGVPGSITDSQVQRKRNRPSSYSSDDDNQATEEEPLPNYDDYIAPAKELMSKNAIFTDSVKAVVDRYAKAYGRLLQHQSDRDLPRTFFPQGITQNSKKAASENLGVLVLLLVILCSSYGDELDSAFGPQRRGQFIHMIETTMMIDNYMRRDDYTLKELQDFKCYIPAYLNSFKETIDRQQGNGMKYIKFHLPLHFVDDMFRFGPCSGYDSGPCEMHHKVLAKQPARLTQRRADKFEIQVARSQIDNLVIDRAYAFLHKDNASTMEQKPSVQLMHNGVSSVTTPQGVSYKGYSFQFADGFIWTTTVLSTAATAKKQHAVWANPELQRDIEELLRAVQLHTTPSIPTLQLFTECKRNGTIFRAHPLYHGATTWQDWALIDWGNRVGKIPAQLLVFVDLSNLVRPMKVNGCTVDSPGMYAVAHSLPEPLDDEEDAAYHTSFLVTKGVKETSTQIIKNSVTGKDESKLMPKLILVNCESIYATCIAVPLDVLGDNVSHSFLFLQSRSLWKETFLKHMKDVVLP
jgi:hypothetical protein